MNSRTIAVTLALVRDTFREAFARKIFWGFFGCSTALILFFIFIMRIDVEPKLVDYMKERAAKAELAQLVPVLAPLSPVGARYSPNTLRSKARPTGWPGSQPACAGWPR